ncbi:MAG: sigma-54-dependent Fis family transcriptional regulator [Acidobacteria bacterium]|nr:sigma-54-dependent Fis family transcriptional regulator [Acidobacteriota bacterium]
MRRIWIVDDESNIGLSLRLILEREGFAVTTFTSASDYRRANGREQVALFLLDVRLPDASGIDLLRELRAAGMTAPAVMISGHGTISDAVEAVHAGAFDFLEKPLHRDRVLLAVRNALDQSVLREENKRLKEQVGSPRMIGASPAFNRIVDQATLAAKSDVRVLLIGESGTGKELLAAHIHAQSPFAGGPFIKVNCAAIPNELMESELFGHERGAFTGAAALRRGKFELADSGTLFLDEVGDLPQAAQAKLLRVLQEGEFHRLGGESPIKVTVRVVSATNKDLSAEVAQGRFREDLYYRLAVVPLRVPALRERPQDVRVLAAHFLEEFCGRNNVRAKQFDGTVFDLFERYSWPGNARELRNVVERMVILSPGDILDKDSAPIELRLGRDPEAPNSVEEARRSAEREHITRALDEASWNVSAAARALGMERTSLHKRIRALGLART